MNLDRKEVALLSPTRLGWIGYLVLYLVFAAVVVRTLAIDSIRQRLVTYLTAELVFLFLFSLALIAKGIPVWMGHVYFALQSALVTWLIAMYAEFDFLILLFLLLSAQAALCFYGRVLWIWIGIFIALSGGSLMFFLGAARGLALSLTTIAGDIVVAAYFIVHREIDAARKHSQSLLAELQAANQRLQSYASQVEGLSALQERNRLATALHDTVNQLMFSISLNTRSAQMMLIAKPEHLPEQLERLQALTGEALAQLRAILTQLRPPQEAPATGQSPPPEGLSPSS